MNISQGLRSFRRLPAFCTQVYHPQHNPHGERHTEDCGPSCLAMALVTLGKERELRQTLPLRCLGFQGLIDSARFAMFQENGQPLDLSKSPFQEVAPGCWKPHFEARQTLTNLEDLERGFSNYGCPTRRITFQELQRDRWFSGLILAGVPSLGQYGRDSGVSYRGGHFIFLPPQCGGEEWLIHDPLRLDGPARVKRQSLFDFLGAAIFGKWSGLEISTETLKERPSLVRG